jgi:integrase
MSQGFGAGPHPRPQPSVVRQPVTPPGAPPAALAVLEHLLGSLAGLPVATTMARPFQWPSLEHLDERLAATVTRSRDVEGLSAKTTAAYSAAYRQFRCFLREAHHERAFLDGNANEQIRVLEGWIAWLRGRGAGHTTINTYWRALHASFARIARQEGSLSPTLFVPTPRPGTPLPRFLTKASLATVFRFVRNYQWPGGTFERTRNVALIATMALGGCRLGEVLRLQVEDVDCLAETLRVKRGKGRRGGKGRIVYLAPALRVALEQYLSSRMARDLATDRLFVSVQGDRPIAEITIRRLCRIITERSGVKVAPHLLRHTCATLLRQGGVPDRLSMEQLGHSSLAVLQRYSHVASGERHAAISQLAFDTSDGAID